MKAVMAAASWPTNGHLIADAARLGYIPSPVLDLSYGRGRFWTEWQPERLIKSDPYPHDDHPVDARIDVADWETFHDSGLDSDGWGTVVWDGPYRLNGTPDLGSFDTDYGVQTMRSWQGRMELLRTGTRFGCGLHPEFLLVKCQDQVVSGRKVWQTHDLTAVAQVCGYRLADQFVMVRPPRPQPAGRSQVHARSNYSTLLIFRAVFDSLDNGAIAP